MNEEMCGDKALDGMDMWNFLNEFGSYRFLFIKPLLIFINMGGKQATIIGK